MKQTFTKIAMMLAIGVAVLSSNALAQNAYRRTVKVNFDFVAGTTKLPAGNYVVEPLNNSMSSHAFVVRNAATGQQAILHVSPTQKKLSVESGAISFNRYGDQAFLSMINMGESRFAIPRSKSEREVEKQFVAQAKANSQTSEMRD
jgi:hypothetical protein